MPILYVARSSKLGRWASDVGLGKNIYKVGAAEGDPKALAAAGWAGETDWTVVRKTAVADLSEAESLALNVRVILLLANHIGDSAVLGEALATARRSLAK